MPATAGRVRMPHNNRMSTSASLKTHAIWQTAIGHDPYANAEEKQDTVTEADKAKAKSVMEMARSQNLTDGAKRDNFTAQMYQGLKRGKQRKGDTLQAGNAVDPQLQQLLEAPSSSSEEEFIEVEVKNKEKKKSGDKKKRKRKRHGSSSDDSSSDESSEDRRRRRRKEKKKRKHRKRSRDYSSGSDSDDSSDERRRRRRKEKRRKEKKKSSRKEDR